VELSDVLAVQQLLRTLCTWKFGREACSWSANSSALAYAGQSAFPDTTNLAMGSRGLLNSNHGNGLKLGAWLRHPKHGGSAN